MKKLLYLTAIAIVVFSCQTREPKTDQTVVTDEQLTAVSFEVIIEGMTCTGCEETIEGSVNKLEGIKMVDAQHLEGNAIIEFFTEKSDTSSIRKAITESGYKVIAFKAVEKAEIPD